MIKPTSVNLVKKIFVSKKNGLKYPISPAGVCVRSNPIKALWNANFYKPKVTTSFDYIKIDDLKGAIPNPELRESLTPFKSVINHFLKSKNMRVTLYPAKFNKAESVLLELDKESRGFVSYSFDTISKDKKIVPPFGFGTVGVPDKKESTNVIFKLLEDLTKSRD